MKVGSPASLRSSASSSSSWLGVDGGAARNTGNPIGFSARRGAGAAFGAAALATSFVALAAPAATTRERHTSAASQRPAAAPPTTSASASASQRRLRGARVSMTLIPSSSFRECFVVVVVTSRESYDDPSVTAKARAYPGWARAVMALLVVAASLGLALLGAAALLANDPPVTPPVLLQAFAIYVALPAYAAWRFAGWFAADVTVRVPDLIIERRGERMEIPLASIERVRAWSLPLPAPGFGIDLRSGKRLQFGLALRDPSPILRALDIARVGGTPEALDGTLASWMSARGEVPPPSRARRLLKFPGFALLPTALLFNVHQQISYGGLLGEYHGMGLAAWLRTFATYWAATTVYLLIWAAAWRVLAELACFGIARVSPSRTEEARRAAELVCGIAYYAGVPLLLLLRFLP